MNSAGRVLSLIQGDLLCNDLTFSEVSVRIALESLLQRRSQKLPHAEYVNCADTNTKDRDVYRHMASTNESATSQN